MFERIYSVGCFDHFHKGHKALFARMRKLGKVIIIGIHDDASLKELKGLRPAHHDDLSTRIENIRPFIDLVFIVPSTDPTRALRSILRSDDNLESACYVRGDDMPDFPGRKEIEGRIAIQLLPYTVGVSSTQLRRRIVLGEAT
ncbi:MAG: adenylyltransferase/cytidyltransferase family protein [Gammaproteobacteria bacterium]|nr:adenylyltransferase/cytidyltransferase family protein [Gammaproteobacteria bacterium]